MQTENTFGFCCRCLSSFFSKARNLADSVTIVIYIQMKGEIVNDEIVQKVDGFSRYVKCCV